MRVPFLIRIAATGPPRLALISIPTGMDDPNRPSDAESGVTIVRITGGNFRLAQRQMSQVARIVTINKLDTVTPGAVEAA